MTIWFSPEGTWRATPTEKRGYQPRYSDAAIRACLKLKVLFGTPLRQATGCVNSLLKLVGGDWEVPDLSMLCRRQKLLSVAIPYRGSKRPNTFWWTVLDFKLREEASGTPASMAAPNAAYDVRWALGSTRKRWRYGRLN